MNQDPAAAAPQRSDGESSPAAIYRSRLEAALADARRIDRRALHLGLLRLLGVALAVGLAIAALDGSKERWAPLLWGLFALDTALFLALGILHGKVASERDRATQLAEVNRRGIARVDGSWIEQPPRPVAQVKRPPYCEDLDITGAASLQLLCDATHSEAGEAALFRALGRAAAPEADPACARARQEAVRELVPLLPLRQAMEVAGLRLRGKDGRKPDPSAFLRWAEGPPLVGGRLPGLRLLAALPLLTVPLLLVRLLLPAWAPWVGTPLLALLVVQGLLVILTTGPVGQLMGTVATGEVALAAYGDLLELLGTTRFAAADNQALQTSVRTDGQGPTELMRRLQGSYGYLELRQNPLLWLPVNFLFLWDLNFALRVERWQAQVGPRLRGWLLAVGELEARASLASLGFDNPDWAWPELVSEPATFVAEALAHPLMPAVRRVGNDVELPGPGRAWLVTGSNMSGKSTLLRSIGLCQVMAQAGAPVCARRVRLSPLTLRTVMRVDDSLARGVSHFYAELQRLKEVVDESRSQPPLCYLLDEILHGTNTRERELGARLVVKTLCRRGATGAVSTHDLSLATLAEETGGAVHNVHFTEIIEGDRMRFDFRLRAGPVQTTNALRLMKECGIDLDWEG